jgi:hypothetical protein
LQVFVIHDLIQMLVRLDLDMLMRYKLQMQDLCMRINKLELDEMNLMLNSQHNQHRNTYVHVVLLYVHLLIIIDGQLVNDYIEQQE